GAIWLSYGSGAGFNTNGAYRRPVVGAGVTMISSLRGSTMHRSAGLPVPARSLTATPAPTEDSHAWIRLYAGLTWRMSLLGRPGGNSTGSEVNLYRAVTPAFSSAEAPGSRATTKSVTISVPASRAGTTRRPRRTFGVDTAAP